jgi:hypothetical protein
MGTIAIGSVNSAGNIAGPNATGVGSIAIGGSNTIGAARATAAAAVALGENAAAAHANAVALGDGSNTTGTNQVNIGTKRFHLGVPTTAPADADLIAGQASFWVDEAGSTLSFKVKLSGGTVKTGTVAIA